MDLHPESLNIPGRYGLGVVLDCPVCVDEHRLIILFRRPWDGYVQLLFPPGSVLYEHDTSRPEGSEDGPFDVLSLCPAIRHEGSLVFVDRGAVVVTPEHDA